MIRVGSGFDVHAFADDRRLILGGVTIPHSRGLTGHSDADVLLHAICDALLGALALGDIGQLFPDDSPAYKDVDSMELLYQVNTRLQEQSAAVINIDATVALQQPKLAPYTDAMRQNIAACLGCSAAQISIKATTTERLGFVGRKEGAAAFAVALLKIGSD